MEAEGVFNAVNNVVSQSVPHLHVHVVPRRRKDGLRGFFWPRTKYRSDEEAQGSFVAVNNVVSQSVPHLHVHVVPRRRKDGLRGFFWPRTKYDDDAHAASVAATLREALA